jgi:hypothetical protein
MKIRAFAWIYAKSCEAKAWLESTDAWRIMSQLRKAARDCVAHMRSFGPMFFPQPQKEADSTSESITLSARLVHSAARSPK